MTQANPEPEAQVQESKIFNFAEPGQEPELRDAWGRNAEEDEAVDLRESEYMGQTAKQLKAELLRREDEEGREFDKGSIKTKRDLVAALEADDAKRIEEAKAAGNDGDQE
jgi:hypothetical protein